ncbi:MAG: isoprenyl transferase [Deltaproteobacteria bacterium]|jgi:undecaprenyl diphosphate synthase|uniref:isoprenyl transferase n=1 Tax=Hydrosulfovibrio ferrireducens TaxID=2934181 RepID=UPI000CBF1000|nr:MAG: isoprenyl transferase [Deltaproteobacteria bacterium HGW-Deltaproteobacteria-16]TDB31060.1 MAG: isoprenyl transferase [Deltaproteobacteria bacterium]
MPKLDTTALPRHIAIIMDGNGRWAEQQGKPRIMGHRAGVESVQDIVRAARELGIGVLTLYAFSTENWKRPPLEVQALMGLLKSFLESELATMVHNNVSLRCLGQKERIPSEVRKVLERVIQETSGNTGLILNLALSYGGRSEITQAVQAIAQKCLAGTLSPGEIDQSMLEQHLYTAGLPDPDLVIRTGGETRLSNFLLWQASYAELYFTEILWPDFRKKDLLHAILDFQKRQRRFGKTGEQAEQTPTH